MSASAIVLNRKHASTNQDREKVSTVILRSEIHQTDVNDAKLYDIYGIRGISELLSVNKSLWIRRVFKQKIHAWNAVSMDYRYLTRSPAVARIADCTGCQWFSRSSRVDDFHLIWQGIWHVLLVINSNLGPISHRVRDMASFPSNFLPPLFSRQFENVFLALDRWNFAWSCLRHIANYLCQKFSYDLTLSHNTFVTDRWTDDYRANSSTVT